jgi:hypothetical protein
MMFGKPNAAQGLLTDMTEEQAEKSGFANWTKHYEKEQEADRLKVDHVVDTMSQLGSGLSRLEALMESWIESQRGVTSRLNRPWQWGVVVAAFMVIFSMSGAFGVIANLIVTPIHATLDRVQIHSMSEEEKYLKLHMWFRDQLEAQAVKDAEMEIEIKWLKLMEERVNGRIHAEMIGTNP